MRSDLGEARSKVLHEQIVPAFVAMLDDASPLDDPAGLEALAATVLVALEPPEMPAEVAGAGAGRRGGRGVWGDRGPPAPRTPRGCSRRSPRWPASRSPRRQRLARSV